MKLRVAWYREQETHWDETNKGNYMMKLNEVSSLCVSSQCVSCSQVWPFLYHDLRAYFEEICHLLSKQTIAKLRPRKANRPSEREGNLKMHLCLKNKKAGVLFNLYVSVCFIPLRSGQSEIYFSYFKSLPFRICKCAAFVTSTGKWPKPYILNSWSWRVFLCKTKIRIQIRVHWNTAT